MVIAATLANERLADNLGMVNRLFVRRSSSLPITFPQVGAERNHAHSPGSLCWGSSEQSSQGCTHDPGRRKYRPAVRVAGGAA
jgi:hypothetical protein